MNCKSNLSQKINNIIPSDECYKFKKIKIYGIYRKTNSRYDRATVEGNPDAIISKFSKIDAGEEQGLSFLANPKYTHYVYTTKATAVLIDKEFIPVRPLSCTLIRVENPYLAFAQLMTMYQEKRHKTGISKHAAIAEGVKIGENVYIGDFVSIAEGVVLGDNVQIYPHTYLGENVSMGIIPSFIQG